MTSGGEDQATFRNSRAWLIQSVYWVAAIVAGIFLGSCEALIQDAQSIQLCLLSSSSSGCWEWNLWEGGIVISCLLCLFQAASTYRNACTSFNRKLNPYSLVVYTSCNGFADAAGGMACFRFGRLGYGMVTEALGLHSTRSGTWYSTAGFLSGYMFFAFYMSQRGAALEPMTWPPHKKPGVRGAPYVPWLILASLCSLLEYHCFYRSFLHVAFNFFFSLWSTVIVCPSPPWAPDETYPIASEEFQKNA